MNSNPFEPPSSLTIPLPSQSAVRVAALRSVRIVLLIMLAPAVYNLFCFNLPVSSRRMELPIYSVYRTINSVGFVFIALAIWLYALAALEFVTGGIYSVFARKSKLDDWKAAIYQHVLRAPIFAFLGAILWALWVAAFYQLKFDFYSLSVPVGIAGHLLAAGFYVPLFVRWYKIERSASGSMTN